jgi:hypothetical protein
MVVPTLLASPRYLSGAITLGGLLPIGAAFAKVQMALNWFVDNFPRIAEWRAAVERVLALDDAIAGIAALNTDPDQPTHIVSEGAGDAIVIGFLEVLFGDAAPLPAPISFDQRFLADDPDGAEAIAEQVQREHGTRQMLHQLVLPTLHSLRDDRGAGVLTPAAASRAASQVAEVTQSLTAEDNPPATLDIAVVPVGGALDLAAAEAKRVIDKA